MARSSPSKTNVSRAPALRKLNFENVSTPYVQFTRSHCNVRFVTLASFFTFVFFSTRCKTLLEFTVINGTFSSGVRRSFGTLLHQHHHALKRLRVRSSWESEDVQRMESTYSSVSGATYSDLHKTAVIVAACFVLVALALSLFLIFQHLKYYTNPAEQKWVVAVLLMVPVYATESIVSLWNPKLSLACDILRNCYEAFTLYSFGRYLIACLGGERQVIELLEDESRKLLQKPLLDHTDTAPKKKGSRFWNFIFQPCVLGEDLLTIEKFGLVQYMILKTVCAFLALILVLLDVYCDGEFKWNCGYPYMAVVLNFSQMWALFCLVQFYNATHERLKSIKPLAKFISFKAIVFATWWQGVGIALLCAIHVLPKEGKLQTGLQDFLICIEMAIAAVAHVFVFPVEPYRYVPIAKSPKVTTEKTVAEVKLEEGDKEEQAVVEKTDTKVEVPGTSVTESVQDIIVEGGHHVVKDVVLTINQVIEPVEKGVAKIQETIHQRSEESDEKDEQVEEVEAEERVELEGEGTESETVVSIEERVVK